METARELLLTIDADAERSARFRCIPFCCSLCSVVFGHLVVLVVLLVIAKGDVALGREVPIIRIGFDEIAAGRSESSRQSILVWLLVAVAEEGPRYHGHCVRESHNSSASGFGFCAITSSLHFDSIGVQEYTVAEHTSPRMDSDSSDERLHDDSNAAGGGASSFNMFSSTSSSGALPDQPGAYEGRYSSYSYASPRATRVAIGGYLGL